MVPSPLKWVGGKHASAPRIVGAFPDPREYDMFVDVCGGAGHITACKPAYHHREIYNDLDNNLVTFWQVMQAHGEELQQRLDAHLFSRKIYYEYYRSLFDGTELAPFERAMRFFYVLRGTGTGWMRRSPVGWCGRDIQNSVGIQFYRSALEHFAAIQERFRMITIDNRDAVATIKRYDSPRTLFYVDPPYFGVEQYYEASRDGFPHEALAQALNKVQGKVALSYYPHPTINTWYADWRRITWQQRKSSQIAIPDREQDIATEMLLCNYQEKAGAASLWDEVSA
jgi:DNA adenine methylase